MTHFNFKNHRVYLRRVDDRGGQWRKLGSGFDGDMSVDFWSADGKTIYFTTGVRATDELLALDVSSGAVRQVTILRQRYRLALELQVIDDGPGVPEEIQDRIFNPLVSGRQGGTGLGLSIVKHAIESQGGSIGVSSRLGVGSIFTM